MITSDDESDHGFGHRIGAASVKRVPWRSRELTELLRFADDLKTLRDYKPSGAKKYGAAFRIRFIADDQEISFWNRGEYPKHLPINCYDKEWFDSLTPLLQEELKRTMQPEVDLSLPADLVRYAHLLLLPTNTTLLIVCISQSNRHSTMVRTQF